MGQWEKLDVRLPHPPPPSLSFALSASALTCSPAGEQILSTLLGLAGQAEPYLLTLSLSLSSLPAAP